MGEIELEKLGFQPARLSFGRSAKSASTWILAAAGLWALVSSVGRLRTTTPTEFGWTDIQPSRDLMWHACYGGEFECARLDLPMDWVEPSDRQRVYLAVIRLPAKTRQDYRGPVFVNPGGPGGSGVDFLVDHGKEMQTIVGDNQPKDMISFDPRGVYASVPRVDCWGSSHTRHDWERTSIDVLDAHPGLVYESYAAADAFSRQCEAHMNATAPGLLEHISTASHARDMLAIAEAAGQTKLRYWGISYGTILGGTFAAMFPDRVERLVSDGNVDYASWYRLDQRNFFEDTDSIMEAFFHFCHKAGPDRCAFALPASSDSSPAAIRDRFFTLLAQLKMKPVLIPAHAFDTARQLPILPELVTYAKLQVLVRTVLYKPFYDFPALAKAMTALEQGDGRPFYAMAGDDDLLQPKICSPNADDTEPGGLEDADRNWGDVFSAITCADGDDVADTPDSFADYAAELQNISRYAGTAYSHFRRGCIGRQIRPHYRYAAPWPGSLPNTSFPILFIGNTGDNVTPLSSAYRNSAVFPGSVVLVQKSWGHASMAAPSTCTAQTVRAYFQDGQLPPADTYCEQDFELFADSETVKDAMGSANDISRAIRKLTSEVSLGRIGKL
ncbi:alpha beta hydrolase fold family [Grosmannia clavigera kw1407]|uniref:Alpha beta hydrolase fold family n=1 Tax=Grosmannia clavigera (strain kw1407 / UAMH 11150) TaxID=655863 RepID=F0XLA1_GROCL|nr:alpha beta hydrolase fold family [Grosmannia clavigera kw1407]EFX01232.1 alpha beta hydrolase fold family [Grosmannia clavigera kw1407]